MARGKIPVLECAYFTSSSLLSDCLSKISHCNCTFNFTVVHSTLVIWYNFFCLSKLSHLDELHIETCKKVSVLFGMAACHSSILGILLSLSNSSCVAWKRMHLKGLRRRYGLRKILMPRLWVIWEKGAVFWCVDWEGCRLNNLNYGSLSLLQKQLILATQTCTSRRGYEIFCTNFTSTWFLTAIPCNDIIACL